MNKQSVYRYLLLMALASLGSAAWASDRSVDETRPAQADGDVRISNLAGSVEVQGWARNEVHVSGELAESVERLEFSSDANGVQIRALLRDDRHEDIDGTRLIVQVPVASRVSVDTASAEIVVKEVAGTQRLQSISGDIQLTSKAADISIETISGTVILQGSGEGAHVEVSSISGDIRISGIRGDLSAASVSGDMEILDSVLARGEFSNTSGDTTFANAVQNAGHYEFSSVSGDIDLRFPALPDAVFDISTFSGEIDNAFGPEPEKASEYSPGLELHFTQGKGGAQVTLNSLSGEVSLRVAGK